MRLGCVLVSLALLVSLVVQPPKAKASFTLTAGAMTTLAAGFLAACGLVPVVSGMSSREDVNASVARLLQDFLDTEVGGVSIADWVGGLGALEISVMGGKLVLPKIVTDNLASFASWVAEKFGTNEDGTVKPGENVVLSGQSITFANGISFSLGSYDQSSVYTLSGGSHHAKIFALGSIIPYSGTKDSGFIRYDIPDSSRYFLAYGYENSLNYGIQFYNGSSPNLGIISSSIVPPYGFSFSKSSTGILSICHLCSRLDTCELYIHELSRGSYGYLYDLLSGSSLSLDVAESITIPDGLTDTQSVALDVGATDSMSVQDILQGILDAILTGDLTATAEVVDTAELPEEPEEPVVPLPPEGLDELGAALTSRFPFSIPWDVYKGIQLLAAPAKAPYFEVDFLAPIAHRVGGWKGNTKIVLDFAEYEIIGQVCRWTSTIGFCLMLAAGTKRLIWTA